MEFTVTCGICGGEAGPHCLSVYCPWARCWKCGAMAPLRQGATWKKV